MKSYPSIARCSVEQTPSVPNVYVFAKLDGSNLRFEWTKKRGWHKFGTRKRLLDESDPIFGRAVPIFLSTLAPELDAVIADEKWKHVVAFAEFHGPSSFAGAHVESEIQRIDLIDIAPDKRGIMSPSDYVRKVYPRVTYRAAYLGLHKWGPELVGKVDRGEFEGQTFEGVVGKHGDKKISMLKAKSQSWKDKDRAHLILNS